MTYQSSSKRDQQHHHISVAVTADLMDGKQGFDSSTSVWQQTGWSEVDNLRKKLENLKELRDLVRQLGRAGGKGPLRMAPQEVQPPLSFEKSALRTMSSWHALAQLHCCTVL